MKMAKSGSRKVTSTKAASAAAKVLANPKSSRAAKTAAGSALAHLPEPSPHLLGGDEHPPVPSDLASEEPADDPPDLARSASFRGLEHEDASKWDHTQRVPHAARDYTDQGVTLAFVVDDLVIFEGLIEAVVAAEAVRPGEHASAAHSGTMGLPERSVLGALRRRVGVSDLETSNTLNSFAVGNLIGAPAGRRGNRTRPPTMEA
ncbi:MAG: hypothetical protein JW751_30320 [Polyangiaceae bacterium]|nr:hypothetical protein [Polyangiaceae bacterium]